MFQRDGLFNKKAEELRKDVRTPLSNPHASPIQGGARPPQVEPPKPENPLLKMNNVILSPHNASASARFDPARKRRVGQELALVLTGRWPMSCVNPTVLPNSGLRRWQPVSMERGPNS